MQFGNPLSTITGTVTTNNAVDLIYQGVANLSSGSAFISGIKTLGSYKSLKIIIIGTSSAGSNSAIYIGGLINTTQQLTMKANYSGINAVRACVNGVPIAYDLSTNFFNDPGDLVQFTLYCASMGAVTVEVYGLGGGEFSQPTAPGQMIATYPLGGMLKSNASPSGSAPATILAATANGLGYAIKTFSSNVNNLYLIDVTGIVAICPGGNTIVCDGVLAIGPVNVQNVSSATGGSGYVTCDVVQLPDNGQPIGGYRGLV
jgi:hypothetical protein